MIFFVVNYDIERWQFESSPTESVYSGKASISGRTLSKTVIVSPVLCIVKKKPVDLNLCIKSTTQIVNLDI